jgi:hypothetical protein
MHDIEHGEPDLKQGLPPRDRNADIPEHANSSTRLDGWRDCGGHRSGPDRLR